MSRVVVHAEGVSVPSPRRGTVWSWESTLRGRTIDTWALGMAFCAVPISIAVSEFFLSVALLARIYSLARGKVRLRFPRIFFVWLVWAGLELLSWGMSPDLRSGWGEMRHLILIAATFFLLPALCNEKDRQMVWRGIFLASTLSSLFLLGDFAARLVSYRSVMGTGDDVSFYLRSGGLLNHWMVYGTVEILVIAGLLSFWSLYPEERRRWWPVAVIQGLAILVSLTRMVWVVVFVLVSIELVSRRSKWFWALPMVPIALYLIAPGPVRIRVNESFRTDYYSNAERLQMVRVGWKMIKTKPLTGVGPGRVEGLYLSYLEPGDPVPAYHGHLHNNLIQLAAEFGIPTALAALATFVVLFRDLLRAARAAVSREARFAARTGLLGVVGFALSGFFDYTFGHSLGLILLCFAALAPLVPGGESASSELRNP